MESGSHTMNDLFSQLGLDSTDEAIEQFIATHKISLSLILADAPFWSQSQASFIKESIEQDADWCEIIDQLNSLLR
ncbi:DUF2789 domain-containing protein [Pseudoalteromonas spongiae]|uniref:DUF2789 domain-containing protein n=1 Tax=Pseudoalteromonas spongiae TaxID=298657 RepID=UPI00110AC4D3|nr:DUF2789 domain-containing protein [Pseudoalteromonas spongiae]TMO87805.1 DUF2789 domain-containing protein [Pseudoalteromonas spongiae]